jgi:DNA-binding MarR family transcriptional regulator
MNQKAKKLYGAIRGLRGCFNRLKALANEMHADLGISASMRAVMETLAEEGGKPVPKIARTKGVSRQQIQVNVNALLKKRLVALTDNPAHKRSPLVALTENGRAAFSEMRRREASTLEYLAADFSADALDNASAILSKLNHRLITLEKEIEDYD